MSYRYQAYTHDGNIVAGTLNVSEEKIAESTLYQAGYRYVLSLEPLPDAFNLARLLPSLFGVKDQDVIDFSRQLATLLEAGISIVTALQLLAGQTSRSVMKKVIVGIGEEVEGGSPFSQACRHYPQAFGNAYYQTVSASEQAGKMEEGLRQTADYLERSSRTRQKVNRALAYPIFVLIMAIGVIAMLFAIALPPLVNLFASLGTELPLSTRILIGLGKFTGSHLTVMLAVASGIAVAGYLYFRTAQGKRFYNRTILRLPLFSNLIFESNLQHICRTMSMLLSAGILLPQILQTIALTINNHIIRGDLEQVRERLVQGEGLAAPIKASARFPRLFAEMVAVGEKTGTMESTFVALADHYEQSVDRRLNMLTAIIEPALIITIGLAVVFIALSIITPLYSILRSMY